MLSFKQFVRETAERGGSINTMFEERLFALIGTLERVATPLSAAGIPYELIGGAAVMVQVQRVEPSAVADLVQMKLSNNRDIDRVHVRDMDSVGLVTADVENLLPGSLRDRLTEIRGSE